MVLEIELKRKLENGSCEKVLSNVCEQVEDALVLLLTARFAEHIPEAKRLISGAGDDGFTVGTQCEVQHTVGVTGEFGDLRQRWILPHEDLILGVAVSRHEFR